MLHYPQNKNKMEKKFTKKRGMKKVWKVNDNDRKIIRCLYKSKTGLHAQGVQELTGLKTSTLYKRLNILRDQKLIENKEQIWKIVNGEYHFCGKILHSKNEIFELHNTSYVLRLTRFPEWWKNRKSRLIKLKGYEFQSVKFGRNNSNPYYQLSNQNFLIQVYPESILIIHRKRYVSNDPYSMATQFLNDVFDLSLWIEENMRFKFFLDGIPQITMRSNDFNRVNDAIANKVKELDTKFLIELDKNRKVWVDLSEPFGKEANYPEAQEILEHHTKDLLLNKPMTNSQLQESIKSVTENQLIFDNNMKSHLEVLGKLGETIDELRKEVKNLKKK